MANKDNKEFLDKIGVQKLWDKINQYFSQIGHRHETSDVNGLDEYMEENAKAIRDTEKVVEELSELPLYPTEEQVGKIYAYDGKLYRGKRLPKLVLDFSKIEGDEEGRVDVETLRDFINQNGKNIVMEYYNENDGEDTSDFSIGGIYFEKYKNGLYIDNNLFFQFQQRNNSETFDYFNKIYVKSLKITAQSPYDEEETYQGCVEYYIDDYGDNNTINSEWWLDNEYPPVIQDKQFKFGKDEAVNLADYIEFGTNEQGCPFTLLKLELELVTCNSSEDYEEGIFHDFLVWEEVSEEELPIEDTTPATEDTRKRFYREIENNNIYVTDKDIESGPGGFSVEVTHDYDNVILNANQASEIIDPRQEWTDNDLTLGGVNSPYGDIRRWTDNLSIEHTFTPIRFGSTNNTVQDNCVFTFTATKSFYVTFVPYFALHSQTGEVVSTDSGTSFNISISVNGVEAFNSSNEWINPTKSEMQTILNNDALFNSDFTYTTDLIDINGVASEVSIRTDRRCYLCRIFNNTGEIAKYTWSQVAKIKDIDDRINALPEVARTGSYTDLFNKPCIGDVQTYDWPNDEDLPIIDEGTGNCDNRLKQLLRWNNSLYTAVVDDSGLTLDLREFSRNYKTQGYCGNSLRNFIFQDRIDIASAAYEDYYVSGNTILIQNTKSRGMQLGSSNGYGNVLLAMRDEGDNKRFLFNEVEVNLQSWNGPDSDIKDYTSDDGNVYIEIGTSERVSDCWELFIEGKIKKGSAYIRSTNGRPTDEFISILDEGYTNVNYNDEVYNVIGYDFDSDVETWLLRFDREIFVVEGEYVTFVDHETPGTGVSHILTPQKTENVWFKRYSDESYSEWVETKYIGKFFEIEDNLLCYIVDSKDGDGYEFIESLTRGDKIKMNNVELTVNYTDDIGKPAIFFDYIDNYPSGDLYTIYKLEQVLINNPVLRETVSLQGTNCDYIRIWTEYKDEQYGRRCVIKSIVFNDIKYEFDEEPRYNRVFYRKDYWKQISGSGSGSIKVIDLTGDE